MQTAVEKVQTWIEALRSGDYKQTTAKLCRRGYGVAGSDFYCCLGVYRQLGYAPDSGHMEGMLQSTDWVDVFGILGNQDHWAKLNDNDGLTFSEIADKLETRLHRFLAQSSGIEVFFVEEGNIDDLDTGWYWWSCQSGCLPDGDAIGPFESEAAALAAVEM